MVDSEYLLLPGQKLKAKDLVTDTTGPWRDKDHARKASEKNLERLTELQQALYAESKHAILVVLQGMDTCGKDGTTRHVFSGVNPQGCYVWSFKAPSLEELSHDYLWRVHQKTPPRGMITIFNRSHYESVLIERVHDLVPKGVWSRRYEHINAFEKLLSDEGTTVIKFFLNISKSEQKKRLEARLTDPKSEWKHNPRDMEERKLWDQYQSAYKDALEKCSTDHAPWYIIPADHKWFRNWAVGDILVRTIAALKPKFPKAIKG
jgi:PPK2 family polyphosphate:nucleotide phosphotransferase